jgi:hypothetical protein
MNWRAKLQEQRGAIFQKGPGDPLTKLTKPQKGQFDSLTKLTKPSSVGFVGDPSGHSANIEVAAPLNVAALKPERARLLALAKTLGIPRAVVDTLPVEELEATAEQAALCEGYMDGNGDPLAHALLVFYLRGLAEKEPAA